MNGLIHNPRWFTRQHRYMQHVPEGIAAWLFDEGSLTARLIAACPGRFQVRVLSLGWQRPFANEARRLRMRLHYRALIRQVYLYCDDTPWVYARTVIPHKTLTGKQRFLAHLGNRPLGAALFADPYMRRDELEVAHLLPRHSLYNSAVQGLAARPESIWGRRSVFYLSDKPLLVNEIFLPNIESGNRLRSS